VLGLGCLQLDSVCGSVWEECGLEDADGLHSQDWRISAWAMKRLALGRWLGSGGIQALAAPDREPLDADLS
jgi:hypothetical protein